MRELARIYIPVRSTYGNKYQILNTSPQAPDEVIAKPRESGRAGSALTSRGVFASLQGRKPQQGAVTPSARRELGREDCPQSAAARWGQCALSGFAIASNSKFLTLNI